MSGVVLRCPACGTTQSHPGECEACVEGQVRYFCGNHSPGLWLDEPLCKGCGVRFGDAPRRPEAAPRGTLSVPAREADRPEYRARKPPGAETRPSDFRRPEPRLADPEDTPTTPSLADVLAHIGERLERTRYREREVTRRETPAEAPYRSIPVMGCLVRLVLFALVLIALLLGGLFMLVGGGF